MVSDDELYRRMVKGEINEAQYIKGVEKNCKHQPELEEHGGGRWTEWCGKCGMKMSSGTNPNLVGAGTGSAKVVKVKGSGCPLVLVLLLGVVVAGVYGVAELLL